MHGFAATPPNLPSGARVKTARRLRIGALAAAWLAHGIAVAQEDDQELAKQSQNPIASIVSFPLQNNTNFRHGSAR